MRNRLGKRLLLSLLAPVFVLACCEVALRLFAPIRDESFVWPPYMTRTLEPRADQYPGVTGPAEFRVNSLGVRGSELAPDDDVIVLAVGGSTTECLALAQDEAWPAVLQELLNDRLDRRAWVGNAGRGGHGTREHVFQVPRLLEQIPRTDVVLVLAGVNDLGLRLAQGADFDPSFLSNDDAEAKQAARAFAVFPASRGGGLPFYKRLELYAWGRFAKNRLLAGLDDGVAHARAGNMLETWRRNRRNATRIREGLPDLAPALAEFERNLGRIVDAIEAAGCIPVLLTQPALWRADLSPAEEALLWWGGVGDFQTEGARTEYYSVLAMAAGLDRYNEVVRDLSSRRGLRCIDLARQLPRSTGIFYDDMHFTEQGARAVAEAVAAELAVPLSR